MWCCLRYEFFIRVIIPAPHLVPSMAVHIYHWPGLCRVESSKQIRLLRTPANIDDPTRFFLYYMSATRKIMWCDSCPPSKIFPLGVSHEIFRNQTLCAVNSNILCFSASINGVACSSYVLNGLSVVILAAPSKLLGFIWLHPLYLSVIFSQH